MWSIHSTKLTLAPMSRYATECPEIGEYLKQFTAVRIKGGSPSRHDGGQAVLWVRKPEFRTVPDSCAMEVKPDSGILHKLVMSALHNSQTTSTVDILPADSPDPETIEINGKVTVMGSGLVDQCNRLVLAKRLLRAN